MDTRHYKLVKQFITEAPAMSYLQLVQAIYDLQVEGDFPADSPVLRYASGCLTQKTGVLTMRDKDNIDQFLGGGPPENEQKNQSCCYLARAVPGCVCMRKEVCDYHGERHFGTHD